MDLNKLKRIPNNSKIASPPKKKKNYQRLKIHCAIIPPNRQLRYSRITPCELFPQFLHKYYLDAPGQGSSLASQPSDVIRVRVESLMFSLCSATLSQIGSQMEIALSGLKIAFSLCCGLVLCFCRNHNPIGFTSKLWVQLCSTIDIWCLSFPI
ncbi:uncharacterized protein YALI1_E12113g [Yarrowia lipolytica]|uniref:Uncharacterized protein n=1 Tax=Yarrowia lipolytica TaxID=4952 RepID=A0A1D8NHT2_YARLL|nr:hypothetical protein YALI1_E12113g [Yarrowia lipolytica]